MVRQIAPPFFTTDLAATLAHYKEKLGFECHFRCAEPPTANPDKYRDELLDAYLFIEDADALYAEYAAQGVEFTRAVANMPWHSREFVVKDGDGRLPAVGANL